MFKVGDIVKMNPKKNDRVWYKTDSYIIMEFDHMIPDRCYCYNLSTRFTELIHSYYLIIDNLKTREQKNLKLKACLM